MYLATENGLPSIDHIVLSAEKRRVRQGKT
ncbi:hypothetical protein [Xanthomonas cannabis]|nr:hypothetical protein [Xanthomonas cannabis]